MGAVGVKVESIQRPDGMRFAGAVPNDEMWEWSPVFHGANPGKRGITLKLDSEEGMALLHRLLAPIVTRTWDQLTVDGAQSTNATVLLAASGVAGAAARDRAAGEALADRRRVHGAYTPQYVVILRFTA